jgi:cation:H+ antiporter
MTGYIIQFLLSAAAIVLAGIVLAHCGDIISKRTQMGGMLVGGLLIAGATSLPEMTVDISAIRLGAPDLAVGDLMGSSIFNLLILAVFDLTRYSHGRMLSQASAAHALAASVSIAMAAMAAIFIQLGPQLESAVFLRVGPGTIVLAVTYLIGFRLIARSREITAEPETKEAENKVPFFGKISLKAAVIGFVAACVVLLIAGPLLAKAADSLAEETGLGGTFFGSTFVAFCTSLPEVATTLTAVRLRAFDMVLGNILGSNSMNMALLLVLDFVDEGSLLSSVSQIHVYTALCVIVVTAVVVLGQLHRVEKKKPFFEPDAWLAIFLIGAALTGLYFVKS